jgi:hypothetical protein
MRVYCEKGFRDLYWREIIFEEMFIEHILELMGNLLMWGCGNLLGSSGDFMFNVGFLMGNAFLLFFGMILCVKLPSKVHFLDLSLSSRDGAALDKQDSLGVEFVDLF